MGGRLPFRRLPRLQQISLATAALGVLWTLFLLIFGGVNVSFFGIRLRSHDPSDPAIVAVVSLAIHAVLRRRARARSEASRAAIGSSIGQWVRTPGNLVFVAILIVAAFARFWALTFGLPHPAARPDEEAVAALAGSYLQGYIRPPSYTYPPLFILVVALAIWLVFQQLPSMLRRLNVPVAPSDPSTSAERTLQRVLSATAGVVSVWLLFRTADRLFGRTTALVAAAFLALAFLHVRDSHFGVTDIPMTCMVLGGFLAIVKLSQSGSRLDLVSAGVLTGLAVATKYNAALLVVPAGFAILADPLRRPLAARVSRAVVFGAIAAVAFLVVCPFAVIDYKTFLNDVLEVSRHLARGHGPDLGRGWTYHLTTTLRHGLGLPLLLAGIAGLVVMVGRDRRTGILVALFPLAYYALSGSGRTVFARHALPLVPFLCLSAAYLVEIAAVVLTNYLRQPRWRIPATAAIATAVLWPSAVSVVAFDRLIAREDSRLLARRWIESRFAPGTAILQLGQTNGHAYIHYETDYVLSEVPSADRPALVILVTSPLASPDLDTVAPWVRREYDLKYWRRVVAEEDPSNTYDRQDELFVPLAGFHEIERPGPNLRIYVRRDLSTPDPPIPER